MRSIRFAALALFVLLPGAAAAQDKVDNPEFANWSKFKKGTSVTMKSVSSFGGMSSEVLVTSTLIESGADKLVLEMTSVVKAAGQEIKSPGMKRDVNKTVALPPGIKKEEFAGGKPAGTFEEGTETLKLGGAEIKTKWYKYKAESGGTKIEAKVWVSDDVPGMIAKSDMSTSGAVATTTKMEVSEIKKP